VDGKIGARQTPIGFLPDEGDLDLTGLDIPPANLHELLRVDTDAWKAEAPDIEKHFARLGGRLPARLRNQLLELEKRLV
jgi:phosphoenolpyruvate carboxykinase (GTP)